MDLHHCEHPVNYHFLLKAPSKHLNKDLTLKQGDHPPLYSYQNKLLGVETTVQIKVVKLERTENIVTTTVSSYSVKELFLHDSLHRAFDSMWKNTENCVPF